MATIKPDTQGGRILEVLVRFYPRGEVYGWAGGPDEFGNEFHKLASRLGDVLEPRGFPTLSRQREGRPWNEYRLASREIYLDALALVRSWETGEDPGVLRKRLADRELAGGRSSDPQGSLGLGSG